ncbi:unnamed protein product [Fusarium graminearum]|nr:unnamed protein product [Fusarium graminearum]VTO84477.1 unnamed protein product [Fusarium graminearum]
MSTCQVEEYLYNTSSQKLIQQNRQIYIYIRTDKMCTTVISIITCSNCRRQLSSVYELTLQCKTFIETGKCPGATYPSVYRWVDTGCSFCT